MCKIFGKGGLRRKDELSSRNLLNKTELTIKQMQDALSTINV